MSEPRLDLPLTVIVGYCAACGARELDPSSGSGCCEEAGAFVPVPYVRAERLEAVEEERDRLRSLLTRLADELGEDGDWEAVKMSTLDEARAVLRPEDAS